MLRLFFFSVGIFKYNISIMSKDGFKYKKIDTMDFGYCSRKGKTYHLCLILVQLTFSPLSIVRLSYVLIILPALISTLENI